MKKLGDELSELIDIYFTIKDELLDHTDKYHDDMHWDIQGYCEEWENLEDEEDEAYYVGLIKQQVEAFTDLKNALDQINYVFC
jgi:hypothetical protein